MAIRLETKHSMLRRCRGWDYRQPCIYMITLVLADRRPKALGRLEILESPHNDRELPLPALNRPLPALNRPLPAQNRPRQAQSGALPAQGGAVVAEEEAVQGLDPGDAAKASQQGESQVMGRFRREAEKNRADEKLVQHKRLQRLVQRYESFSE